MGMFFGLMMLIALVGLGNFYIVKRVKQCVSYRFPNLHKGFYIGLFVFLVLLLTAGFFRTRLGLPKGISSFLGVINGYWMGLFLYLLLFLLLADLVLLVLRLCKALAKPLPHKTRALSVLIAFAVALGGCCYGWIHVNNIQTAFYQIAFAPKSIGDSVKMVLVSDLHLGSPGWQGRLANTVDAINAQNPDIVCIAGDIFDSDFHAMDHPEKAKALLTSLTSKYGVYASLGNHDGGSTFPQMVSFIKECKVTLLADQAVEINGKFILAGRLDSSPIGGYGEYTRKSLGDVLEGMNTDLPVIVMEHNPAHGDAYTVKDADLILSGHTHKGQIFPANLFTNFIYTEDYGYYRESENHPHRVITSGAGIWGMPMRVGTNSEIVVLTLS